MSQLSDVVDAYADCIAAALPGYRRSVFSNPLDIIDAAGNHGRLFSVLPSEQEWTTDIRQPTRRRADTGSRLQPMTVLNLRLARRLQAGQGAELDQVRGLLDDHEAMLVGFGDLPAGNPSPRFRRALWSIAGSWMIVVTATEIYWPTGGS